MSCLTNSDDDCEELKRYTNKLSANTARNKLVTEKVHNKQLKNKLADAELKIEDLLSTIEESNEIISNQTEQINDLKTQCTNLLIENTLIKYLISDIVEIVFRYFE